MYVQYELPSSLPPNSTVRRGSHVQVQQENLHLHPLVWVQVACQQCCNLCVPLVWVAVCSIILAITREAPCDTNLDTFIWGFWALNIVVCFVVGASFSLVWICLGTAWYFQTGECPEHLVNLSLVVLILAWIGIVSSFCLVFCILIAMSLQKRQEQEQEQQEQHRRLSQEQHRRSSNPYAVASQV
ncbi:unnamed protein product [Vitrella brassicaformis CCMP3155]|uniref:Uncharacterized protein n=1 Tax=Vitrella brassicaformis (strain CCMP3155) TaxID=1169540 RepID=A0A0G4H3E2_VITBC|nr:unnamed protein product [Vitrella brassicaformis CCMP3155]|eukprot:CEM38222.1 unnamed protein product [Vitrella brassicaformis CCMP3155]